jgi:hypothetical protein
MNPLTEWIETIVRINRENAEDIEFYRKVQDRFFIFGIEIGLKRTLSLKERLLYEKTLLTARFFLSFREKSLSLGGRSMPLEQITDECLDDWLGKEPKVKALLEKLMGQSLESLNLSQGLSPDLLDLITDQLKWISSLYPDEFPEEEIDSFLDRLEHPLDRA